MFNWLKNLFDRFTIRLGAARSPRWNEVRKEFLKHFPECAVCGKKGKIRSNEVHHIKPFHLEPSRELSAGNLITLCRPDHLLFGHLNSWFSFNEDVVKDAKKWFDAIKGRP